jgi:uncharacterized FAD-dependent dehydrogenase
MGVELGKALKQPIPDSFIPQCNIMRQTRVHGIHRNNAHHKYNPLRRNQGSRTKPAVLVCGRTGVETLNRMLAH